MSRERKKQRIPSVPPRFFTGNTLVVKIVPFNRKSMPKIFLDNCSNYNGNKKERVSFDAKDEIKYLNIRANTCSLVL